MKLRIERQDNINKRGCANHTDYRPDVIYSIILIDGKVSTYTFLCPDCCVFLNLVKEDKNQIKELKRTIKEQQKSINDKLWRLSKK